MKEFVEMAAIVADLIVDLEKIEYKKQKLRVKKAKPKRRKRRVRKAYVDVDYKQITGGNDK